MNPSCSLICTVWSRSFTALNIIGSFFHSYVNLSSSFFSKLLSLLSLVSCLWQNVPQNVSFCSNHKVKVSPVFSSWVLTWLTRYFMLQRHQQRVSRNGEYVEIIEHKYILLGGIPWILMCWRRAESSWVLRRGFPVAGSSSLYRSAGLKGHIF